MKSCKPSRREFLQLTGAAGAVSLGGLLPQVWSRCLAAETPSVSRDRILVVVQLAGGNDGLNTLVPIDNDDYYKARPGIAIGRNAALKLNDRLGLHPSLTGFRDFWEAGRLAVIEGVGYPQPDRSHFRSMDIWHSAQPQEAYPQTGWIGRSLDVAQSRAADGREAACIGMAKQPLACIGAAALPPTIQRLEDFRLHHTPGHTGGLESPQWTDAVTPPAATSQTDLDFLRRASLATVTSARLLEKLSHDTPRGNYPQGEFSQRLKLVSQMIGAELPTRIYFVSLDGFDTHSQQLPGHAVLLRELSEGVTAFLTDLEEQGLTERVLLTTFSEFGRRVAENGSLGTDHGSSSVLFSITPPGKGGVFGQPPSLTDLDDGDPKFTTDFRRVYATLLDRWLELPSESILGSQFEPIPFV